MRISHSSMKDRESAIREALAHLIPPNLAERLEYDIVEAYIECEALQSCTHPDMTYSDLARVSLQDFGNQLGLSFKEDMLDGAFKHILQPRLHEDVEKSISNLRAHGYTLLALPPVDRATLSEYIEPSLPAGISLGACPESSSPLYDQNPTLFSALLDHCDSIHPGIKSCQILVVSTGQYRVLEPAGIAGLPTAFIRRENNLESNINLGTTAPTFVANGLDGLCSQLNAGSGLDTSSEALPISVTDDIRIQKFRIKWFYQVTRALGSGSFGTWDCGFVENSKFLLFT